MVAPRSSLSRLLVSTVALAAAALVCAVSVPLVAATARVGGGASDATETPPRSAERSPCPDCREGRARTASPLRSVPAASASEAADAARSSEETDEPAHPSPSPGDRAKAVLPAPPTRPAPPTVGPQPPDAADAAPSPVGPRPGPDGGTAHAPAARPWQPGSGADWPLSPAPALLRLWEPPPAPWAPGHRGVDLAASPGDLVRAAVDGHVSFAGAVAGRDVLVITVAGTNLRMTHEPVTARVAVGSAVRRGQLVGAVADGPFHCADGCVHWGLLEGRTYLDPLTLLRRGPSRLLPVLDVPLPTGRSEHESRAEAAPSRPAVPRRAAGQRSHRSQRADRRTRSARGPARGPRAGDGPQRPPVPERAGPPRS
ncbi:M23 family metallopeptidase [Streptomyces bohaiensis]|uniref:M23 family metallopeptidase n=1 Tax=Streptomyces bohaiensis TaxID=1431344 RepID=A0ABX1C3T5_9ACTN|nr:M23 family metallopeptidase [Streptomyces bohaiensis]NJQ13891.1 M23 family metallopeptidase [Streptomyces bohaiensis]